MLTNFRFALVSLCDQIDQSDYVGVQIQRICTPTYLICLFAISRALLTTQYKHSLLPKAYKSSICITCFIVYNDASWRSPDRSADAHALRARATADASAVALARRAWASTDRSGLRPDASDTLVSLCDQIDQSFALIYLFAIALYLMQIFDLQKDLCLITELVYGYPLFAPL